MVYYAVSYTHLDVYKRQYLDSPRQTDTEKMPDGQVKTEDSLVLSIKKNKHIYKNKNYFRLL